MKTLTVTLPGRSYDILIAPSLLDRAGAAIQRVCPQAKRLFVVTDFNVLPLYLSRLSDGLKRMSYQVVCHAVPAGESAKCAEQLVILWEKMMAAGLTRTDAVVALGGGVVGDLAGFAAATILRGVDFIQIPTTLLAQVDSSVGGKVAIDLAHGKNLAGAFWQPKLVLMDPNVLDTLPLPTFMDGMAEVVKYGCIRDAAFFDFLAQRAAQPSARASLMAEIEHILYTCCEIKRNVVEQDERDTGERMLLNFGHTIGHAYELAGHYTEWTHGSAVSAGMCAAARLGVALGVTPAEVPERLETVLSALGLPTAIPCTAEDYTAAVGLDKKGAGDHISVILLAALGRAVPHRMPKAELLRRLEALI